MRSSSGASWPGRRRSSADQVVDRPLQVGRAQVGERHDPARRDRDPRLVTRAGSRRLVPPRGSGQFSPSSSSTAPVQCARDGQGHARHGAPVRRSREGELALRRAPADERPRRHRRPARRAGNRRRAPHRRAGAYTSSGPGARAPRRRGTRSERRQRARLVRRAQELDRLDPVVRERHAAPQRRAVREPGRHDGEAEEREQEEERRVAPAPRPPERRRARAQGRAAPPGRPARGQHSRRPGRERPQRAAVPDPDVVVQKPISRSDSDSDVVDQIVPGCSLKRQEVRRALRLHEHGGSPTTPGRPRSPRPSAAATAAARRPPRRPTRARRRRAAPGRAAPRRSWRRSRRRRCS